MRIQSLGCFAPIAAVGAAFCAVSSLSGCGSNSGPGLISQLITRAAGGTVTFANAATVTIPANSLAADTTITVQPAASLPSPPAGMAVVSGTGYAFGPDGTAFSPNATLVFSYIPTGLPTNVPATSLQVGTVVSGAWQLLGGTVDTTAHTVTVSIPHFTSYALLGTIAIPTLNPKDFAGNWSGHWVNTTFGSQNNATLAVAVTESTKTATMTLQIFGDVLGTFTNPPAENFTGTYDTTHFTISANSNIFGAATLNIDSAGNLTGHANTTSNTRVSSVDLTGTVNSQSMNTTYTVHFRDGTSATGTLTFTKN